MVEAFAVLGGVGSIFSIVNGISKVVCTIQELQVKWGEADLTLLSLASQLIALRAASTKIQEWMDQDLQGTHHQLVMDLDVSISCCKLLMKKIESFFTDLAQLTEKPLDFREKFKIVFGSSGPESVQKLIQHQTSSLMLLLTACNCKTISEQQRYLGTHHTRKVLNRAKADSMALYAHRDSASFVSAKTGKMSKMSRVFEFNSDISSTAIYERVSRASFRDLLGRRQHALKARAKAAKTTGSAPKSESFESMCFLGPDQIGIDLLVDTLHSDQDTLPDEWALYQWEVRKLFPSLINAIIKSRSDAWNSEDAKLIMRFMHAQGTERFSQSPSMFHDSLEACIRIWEGAIQLGQELHTFHSPRERLEFEKMVFWVRMIPDRGLSISGGNYAARSFARRMERILPASSSDPFQDTRRLADILRGTAMAFEDVVFQLPIEAPGSVKIVDPNEHRHEDGVAYMFFADLQDYSLDPEFERRVARSSLALRGLLTAHQQPVIGLVLRHSGKVTQQAKTSGSSSKGGRRIGDTAQAIAHITMVIKSHLKVEAWNFSFILSQTEDLHPAGTLLQLKEIIRDMTVRTRPSSVSQR